ncbi:MAG TPA: phytanoyl-CoA dioxygenase family protein [Ardenticatenaceae bacterium]|jgi:ectoine hydroxylase-related dioxygenase (phytanoyl-CoA dioxygenase family)
MTESTMTLTDEQIDFFHRNGYLVLDAMTTPEEIAMIRDVYDRLFASHAGRETGDQFDLAGTDDADEEAVLPQLMNPEKYAPELQDTQYKRNAAAIAQQLLGTDKLNFFGHAIMKPPGIGAPTAIHQDEAYWSPGEEHDGISIWMPLQDTSVEMGCMQFVPGSNQQGVLPHRSIGGDPRVHGLEVDPEVTNLGELVQCPLPVGGATIHHCRTLHYAGPNTTEQVRRAYIMVFNAPPKPLDKSRDFPWQAARATARAARAAEAREKS